MDVQANGIRVSVDTDGSGPAVVLIHGLSEDRTLWDDQIDDLARDYKVIAYDVRGHGRSEKPHTDYSLDLLVEDLRALLEALGETQATLVGFSLGGMISQAFTLAHPEMVKAMVLVDTVARFPNGGAMFAERSKTAELQGMAPLVDGMLSRWFTPEYIAKNPERMASFRNKVLANDPIAFAATCRVAVGFDLLDRLSEIKAPTLLLYGEHDLATPVALGKEIQSRIKGAELKIIEGAAHTGPVERPETFNRLLLEFLDKVHA